MTTQTPEQKFDWHTSQAKWHSRRPGRWHQLQALWHRRQIRRIPGVFGIVVSRTIRTHLPAIAENIASTNALFRLIKE